MTEPDNKELFDFVQDQMNANLQRLNLTNSINSVTKADLFIGELNKLTTDFINKNKKTLTGPTSL